MDFFRIVVSCRFNPGYHYPVPGKANRPRNGIHSKERSENRLYSVAVRNAPDPVLNITTRLFTQLNRLFSGLRKLEHHCRAVITDVAAGAAVTLRNPGPAARFPAYMLPFVFESLPQCVRADCVKPCARRHRSFPVYRKRGPPSGTVDPAFITFMFASSERRQPVRVDFFCFNPVQRIHCLIDTDLQINRQIILLGRPPGLFPRCENGMAYRYRYAVPSVP